MIGSWKGGSFDTGHSTHKVLDDFKWAGKDFRSVDDVDPIMIYKEDGSRVWLEDYGHARVSSPIAYEAQPRPSNRPDLFKGIGANRVVVSVFCVRAASQG